tara:strand:+ start:156 stop:503 length:348 start_codon:yes stop_codon:yes gene_type:complete
MREKDPRLIHLLEPLISSPKNKVRNNNAKNNINNVIQNNLIYFVSIIEIKINIKKPDAKYKACILKNANRLLLRYLLVPGLIVKLINRPKIINIVIQKKIGLFISIIQFVTIDCS